MKNEEFYIGYLDQSPAGIRGFTRKTVIALILASIVVVLLWTVGQRSFYPSTFEFLQYRSFEGVLEEHPYPMLRVMRPGDTGDLPTFSNYYLVNEGKFGVQDIVRGLEGRRVRFEGALIYRDDQIMIEMKPGTLEDMNEAELAHASEPRNLGTFTLTGEIVDSKCFLGVMNPGNRTTHRACAARCISGGVPPIFFIKGNRGTYSYLVLQGTDGSTVNKDVLDVVAEPLEITGEVVQVEDVLYLKADPASYRRLAP